jgi:hypothetical protein
MVHHLWLVRLHKINMERGFSKSRVSSPLDYPRQKALSKASLKNLPSRSSRTRCHISGVEDGATCSDAEIGIASGELSGADADGT